MKSVSDWKFSASLADVDLPRIMREAEEGCKGRARGVVLVTLPTGVIVLVNNELRRGKFDLQRPNGFLTTTTKVESKGGLISGHEPGTTYAPSGAVAIYRFATAQEADVFLGKVLDRVEVKVEVF